MATINVILDRRKVKTGGTYPLKVKISKGGHAACIPLGIDLKDDEWDEASRLVVNRHDRNRLNAEILTKVSSFEQTLKEMNLKELSVTQVRDRLLNPESPDLFLPRYIRYMEHCETEGNRKMYEMCLVCMRKYDPDLEERTFADIDKDWLTSFDRFLSGTMSVNTRSIRMRCIRTVFNDAIDNDVTDKYPFRRFKIRQESTRKRSLTVEQVRQLRDFKCSRYQTEYRDIWMLMLYLAGINAADLFQARKSDVMNGRLEYRRQKTHRLYSVKIEPEAQVIIDRYAGKGEYLLSVLDRYSDYRDYLAHMNRNLKAIGRPEGKRGKALGKGIFPELSSYWCRHTVATLAAEIDVPVDTISLMLGHSFGNAVTQIYIRQDEKKADEAMRKVIDYISK